MLPVGPGYFGLYYVPLKQGREFTAADRVGADPVAVISQTLRHTLWPDGDAIGQQIRVVEGDTPDSPLGPWRTIVGVVGDIRQGYDDSDLRDIYLPFLQVPSRFASVHIRTRRSLPFWDKSVRTAATELEPRVYVSPATTILSEDRQRAGTQFIASILSGFALFATLLATLGIYSVTAYAVQQREREVAIRNAVGASKRAIISLFLKQGGQILIIGLAFGLVGVFSAAKILKNRLYEVEPFDFATILFTCLLIGLIGLFAVWWPARRAAARNPMSVLKEG
jgi:putative ABC transport system permease protein